MSRLEVVATNCFICGRRVTQDRRNSEISRRYLVLVSRYLDFDFGFSKQSNVTLRTKDVDNDDLREDQTCKDCLSVVQSFCDMYDVSQLLQLELCKNLEEVMKRVAGIGDVKEEAGSVPPHHRAFRKSLSEYVNMKMRRSFPVLHLRPTLPTKSKTLDFHGHLSGDNQPKEFSEGPAMKNRKLGFRHLTAGIAKFSMSPIASHKLIKHEKANKLPRTKLDKPIRHSCIFCTMFFSSNDDLSCHLRSHVRERTYECHVCGKHLNTKGSLNVHKRLLHQIRNEKFTCVFCQRSFPIMQYLEDHMQTHTREKPYNCKFCSKHFSNRGALSRHQAGHTGIASHQCSICSKKFSVRWDLVCHLRLHTGEKPYKCHWCECRFSHGGNRSKHERAHHKDNTKHDKPSSQASEGTNKIKIKKESDTEQIQISDTFLVKEEYH